MKIILSRKGFDESNGGMASPILPDGTMLSLPIPVNDNSSLPTYNDLEHDGRSYAEIISDLSGNELATQAAVHCHVDPDISKVGRDSDKPWKPAFGQTGSSQGYLRNRDVEPGDIFLFFGWFRHTEEDDAKLRWKDDSSDLHAIFGYLQVGEILTEPSEIAKYYWHPHASAEYADDSNNALYIPTERLSIDPSLPGWGTLEFRADRVLTADGQPKRSIWAVENRDFLLPHNLVQGGTRRNLSEEPGQLQYGGIFQELVYTGTPEMQDWVRSVIQGVDTE